MSDGKAALLGLFAFLALMWGMTHAWDVALSHSWVADNVVQAATDHADDDADRPEPDDPRWYVTMAAIGIAAALGFRVYHWALAGRWRGNLTPKEYALSSDALICSVAVLAASIAVSVTGLTVPASGILRIGAFAAIAFAGWRLYPWLERRAPR